MKRTAIMILVVFFAMTCMVYAGAKTEDNCGCGLGTLIFEDQNDGLMSQTAAATTNGTLGNQTFGITSGTLGCEKFKTFTMNEKLDIFVAENMDNVAADIASGQGETLEAIADLAEVGAENRGGLYAMLQDNFDVIYPNAQTTHEEVVRKIVAIITQI